jgi:exopolysaccharide biosynthesis polyprenyl glycosylphosphotransferase
VTPPTSTTQIPRLIEPTALLDGVSHEAPPKRRRRGLESRLSFSADATMLLAAAALSLTFAPLSRAADPLNWFAVSAIGILLVLALTGSYAQPARQPLSQVLRKAASVPALVVLCVWTVRLLAGELPAADGLIITWLVCTAALSAGRVGGAAILKSKALRPALDQRVLIVGAGNVGRLVAKRLQDQPGLGMTPIGFLDKEPRDTLTSNLPVVGASWDLEQVIRTHEVDTVVVTFSTAPHRVLLDLIHRCWDAGVSVMMVPRLFEAESSRVRVQHLGALPLVGVVGPDTDGWQLRLKYAFDRVMALLLLVVMAPVLALIAAAILVSMGRPIFYRQRRVGRDGHVFAMYKFRTMRGSPQENGESDADWAASVLGPLRSQPASVGEDRRTRLGSFLRSWSLDELPQILNVLYGEMSLIGPRPERVHYVERFSDVVYRYADRHRVRSGITGWAQIHGLRGKTSLADRVEWDNYYIENWSLGLDLKILASSLRAVIRTRDYDD